MAKITKARTGESVKVEDGDEIRQACEDLGVPFSCADGVCGTCMIDRIKGEENLSELTEQEKDLDRNEKHRLACQCKIKKGEVKFDFEEF